MVKDIAKKHCNLLIAFVVNIFFLLLVLLTCGTHYELSDDWFFSENIANGYYDYTFCSYFIQALTGVVQRFIYPVNAFILLQLVLGFTAMITISYIFLDTFNTKKGILYVLIIESVFAVNIYSLITFTKTAAFLCVAGGIMMLWAYHNKKHLGYSIFGIVMVLFGSFYRFKIFYSVLAVFFLFICGLLIIKLKKFNVKSVLELAKEVLSVKTVSLVLAMIILVFSCNHISGKIIYSGEGMDYYKDYNHLRSSVVDYAMPDYNNEEVKKKFEAIGISENDFTIMRLWYLDDQGYADVDTLKQICELQETEQRVWYKTIVSMVIVEFLAITRLTLEGILILAYLILAVILLLLYKKKSMFVVGTITASIGLMYSYLWLSGRVNYRAVFSIWIASTICLLYSVKFLEYRDWVLKFKEKNKKKISIATATIVVVFALVFTTLTVTIPIKTLSQSFDDDYSGIEEYINSSENKIFALSRQPYLFIRNVLKMNNPLVLTENSAFDKCIYFGSPYYAHPRHIEMLENAGIDNPYTDIIDNEDIYFVDMFKEDVDIENIGYFMTYINEQYSENGPYDSELIDTVGDFKIYKIVSVN